MKKKILTLMLGFLLIAVNLYAAGDLIVDGNVGIGTTTPTAKLDVVGDIKGTGGLWLNGSTGSTPTSGWGTRLMWIPSKGAFRAGYLESVNSTYWDAGNIGNYSFAAGGSVMAKGNYSFVVGYKNQATSPNTFVAGSYNTVTRPGGIAIGRGLLIDGGSGTYGINLGYYGNASGNKGIKIGGWTGTYEYYSFDASGEGSIVIGTVDDYADMAATGYYSIVIGRNLQATNSSAIAIGRDFINSTADSFAVGFGQIDLLVTGGNVGIGTTTPAYKLDVAGTVNASSGYSQVSDVKFKKDITAIESPLNKILNIKGVSYSFKTDEYKEMGFSEGTHYGVIGQEVEKVLPEVVKENPNGEKTVSYTELIPVLIEAVKEQQKVIEELKAEVRQLKAKDLVAKSQ